MIETQEMSETQFSGTKRQHEEFLESPNKIAKTPESLTIHQREELNENDMRDQWNNTVSQVSSPDELPTFADEHLETKEEEKIASGQPSPPKNKTQKKYDIIVIGSGFCGYSVAKYLLEHHRSCKVLVIEQGPKKFQENANHNFKSSQTATDPHIPKNTALDSKLSFRDIGFYYFGGDSIAWTAWCVLMDELNAPNELVGFVKKAFMEYQEAAKNTLNAQPSNSELQKIFSSILGKKLCNQSSGGITMRDIHDALIAYNEDKSNLFCTVQPFEALKKEHGDRLDWEEVSVNKLEIENDSVNNLVFKDSSVPNRDCNGSKVVLAGGCFGNTELLLRSFDGGKLQDSVGKQLGAHFVVKKHLVSIPAANLGLEISGMELAQYHIRVPEPNGLGKSHIQLRVLTVPGDCSDVEKYSNERKLIIPAAFNWKRPANDDKAYVLLCLTGLGELETGNSCTLSTSKNNLCVNITPTEKDEHLYKHLLNTMRDLLEKIIGKTEGVTYFCSDQIWRKEIPEAPKMAELTHPTSTYPMKLETPYTIASLNNLYLTGTGLWPSAASLNPTLSIAAMAIHLAKEICEQLDQYCCY